MRGFRIGSSLLFYLVYGLVYTGWLFHRSTAPVWGGYSSTYLAFLVVAALPFALPPIVWRAAATLGRRHFLFASAALGAGLALAYIVAAQVYYHSRLHPFDPFLQMPAAPIAVPVEKAPGTVRILALGGSTTACGRLAESDRYPEQLEVALRAMGADVEVINAGVDWWTTRHSLIHYTTTARRWKPDIVVVMHAINDMYRSFETPDFTLGPYRDDWSHFYGPSIQGAVPPTFESTVLDLPIGSWFSLLRIRPARMPIEQFRSIDAFERNLTTIAEFVGYDEGVVVLVTQPSLYRPDMGDEERAALWMDKADFVVRDGYFTQRYADPESLHAAMAAFNAMVVRVANRQGTLLADAASAVPRDLAHFTDDVHYQPRGARLVAQSVADAIRSAGLIEGARSAVR